MWSPSYMGLKNSRQNVKHVEVPVIHGFKKFQTKFIRGPVESVWMRRLMLYGWFRIFSYIHPIRMTHNKPM